MTQPVAPPSAVWHAGMRLTVLMDAERTGGHFALCEFRAPLGAGTPIHRHEHEDEVVYVRAGCLEIWQRGTVHAVRAGGSMILRRGLPHRLVGASEEPTEFLLAIIPGGFEATLLATSSPAADSSPDPDDIAALFAGAGVSIFGWQTAASPLTAIERTAPECGPGTGAR